MSEGQTRGPLYGGRGRASIPRGATGTGMLSPSTPFISLDDGTLTAVGFRFLFTLWEKLGLSQTQVATLQARTAEAATVEGALDADVAAVRRELQALEARVAALEARLP